MSDFNPENLPLTTTLAQIQARWRNDGIKQRTGLDLTRQSNRRQFLNAVIDDMAAQNNLDRVKDYDRLFRDAWGKCRPLFANMKMVKP